MQRWGYLRFLRNLKGGFKLDDPSISKLHENDSTQGIPTDRAVDDESAGFIVPPGLHDHIPMFEAHCRSAKENPIMIVGPTGVGKSLFLHIYEKLYREENKHGKVVWANCAHFRGGLARSELFGYIRGAFTGALQNTAGLVEEANNGVLILEEIGDLSLEEQAMLLTFVETKKYRRVGDRKEKEASVRIIGATNRENKLRPDFRYRFYPFYVPPIHERRYDILYYVYVKFPEILKTLSRCETLALLAYNWPGNVREIERVCRLIKRNIPFSDFSGYFCDRGSLTKFGESLGRLKKLETELNSSLILSLYNNLQKEGIDVNTLESILNRDRLGFRSQSPAFPELLKGCLEYDLNDRFGIKVFFPFEPFLEAWGGYLVFCSLFFQDEYGNKNNFLINKCTSVAPLGETIVDFVDRKFQGRYRKLLGQVFQFLSGIETEIPDDLDSLEEFCVDLSHKFPSNAFLAPLRKRYPVKRKEEQADIWSMKYEDAMRHYHKVLIERAGGNKVKAAERIGVNYRTFNSRCSRLFGREAANPNGKRTGRLSKA
jgi:hypothetical protein